VRVQAEQERTYRLLFESIPIPMWVYDVETLAFLEVNSAAVARYGFSRDEFLSMTLGDVRPVDELPALLAGLPQDDSPEASGPWTHQSRSGSVIQVEIRSHAVSFGDRRARFVVAEDVTDRERAQRQVQQSQRLESLGRLAGGVAHDFNNLLAVILNYASFVTEAIVESRSGADRLEDAERDADQIRIAAERATRLTRQLLSFARQDAAAPGVVNLNDVVAEVETLLRRTLGEQIMLTTSPARDLRLVLADPGQLEQVLVNLAVNARDAMPQGGTLTIDTANVEIDADYVAQRAGLTVGPHVRLRVSDTGVGMPQDVIDRAFDPFFTTKGPGAGTGLGLATVYGIITRAGGLPRFHSKPGIGTTFTALLPATDQSAPAAEPQAEALQGAGDETILVVDDEGALREVTRRILTRSGYQVITAADGLEALELAKMHAGPIHLVLTDVVMPSMSGSELAGRLRELRPDVRVLFMSGYAQPVLAGTERLEELGAGLVEKPFSAAGLAAKVREVLDEPQSAAILTHA
jgi:two-component system cell cycle sensor histidine kinase/response regulator CckA